MTVYVGVIVVDVVLMGQENHPMTNYVTSQLKRGGQGTVNAVTG